MYIYIVAVGSKCPIYYFSSKLVIYIFFSFFVFQTRDNTESIAFTESPHPTSIIETTPTANNPRRKRSRHSSYGDEIVSSNKISTPSATPDGGSSWMQKIFRK